MVDIALDPNMYYMTMSTADTLRKAAELGFRYVELSPNNEFHLWHHYPKADRAFIEDLRKAEKDSGVEVRTLNPVFNWSSPDEAERMAQVRNWRRLLELADALDVRDIVSEFSGDRNRASRSEQQWYRSIEELTPHFERYGIRLAMEAHPYDFVELHDRALELVRSVDEDWLGYEYCCPHTFHLSDGAGDAGRMIRVLDLHDRVRALGEGGTRHNAHRLASLKEVLASVARRNVSHNRQHPRAIARQVITAQRKTIHRRIRERRQRDQRVEVDSQPAPQALLSGQRFMREDMAERQSLNEVAVLHRGQRRIVHATSVGVRALVGWPGVGRWGAGGGARPAGRRWWVRGHRVRCCRV